MTTSLHPLDIAALRCSVPAVLLAPALMRPGVAGPRLGWGKLGVAIAGAGAPYVLIASLGLRFAPAADQVVLNPGMVPFFVALLAAIIFGERVPRGRSCGLALIALGAVVVVVSHAIAWSMPRLLADVLCLVAALLWASFTIVIGRTNLDAVRAAAIVAAGSSVLYLPIYVIVCRSCLARLPLVELALQVAFQGVLVNTVALVCYGRSVAIFGASGGAVFGAVVPVLAAVIAIPLLGEWPGTVDWLALAFVTKGIYLAGGGPLPRAWCNRSVGLPL